MHIVGTEALHQLNQPCLVEGFDVLLAQFLKVDVDVRDVVDLHFLELK